MTQLPCGSFSLLYRGCDILQNLTQITLKDCCPASSSFPRFSAVYTAPEEPSQVGGGCLEGQTLYVKTLTGRTWGFHICLSHTSILDFKRMITFKSGIPTDQQRLIFAGRQLGDEGTLSSHGVQGEYVLHLVVRMRSPELAVHTVDIVSLATLSSWLCLHRSIPTLAHDWHQTPACSPHQSGVIVAEALILPANVPTPSAVPISAQSLPLLSS